MVGDVEALDRRVTEEHQRLAPLFDAGAAALAASDPSAVEAAIATLLRAVDAHLTQEDRMYYPALWTWRPELRGALERFIEAHERFREELQEIAEGLDPADLTVTTERFRSFTRSFAVHEVHEEEFLQNL